MSGINGDKSRFNRERKQKIARRKRNRERLNSLAGQHKKDDCCRDDRKLNQRSPKKWNSHPAPPLM